MQYRFAIIYETLSIVGWMNYDCIFCGQYFRVVMVCTHSNGPYIFSSQSFTRWLLTFENTQIRPSRKKSDPTYEKKKKLDPDATSEKKSGFWIGPWKRPGPYLIFPNKIHLLLFFFRYDSQNILYTILYYKFDK